MATSQDTGEIGPNLRPAVSWYHRHDRRVITVLGGILSLVGVLVGIYSDIVRKFIDHHLVLLLWAAGTIVLIAGAAYAGSLAGAHRIRERLVLIKDDSQVIGPEVARGIKTDDAVVGRSLRYLECVSDSPDLIVFLHGLGLDANDFRGFMAESQYHTMAVTMFGFDERDRDDKRYGVISLESHMVVLESFLRWLKRQYAGKTLHLVGFSFGADLLMFLAERQATRGGQLAETILLLDPNVNRESMYISTALSQLDTSDPIAGLKKILDGTSTTFEFQNICEYLRKVCSKNLAQVQQLAVDVRNRWDESGYDQFMARLDAIDEGSQRASVVFSFHYEQHFNALLRAAASRNLYRTELHSTEFDHFQLIAPGPLQRQLGSLVPKPERQSAVPVSGS